MRKSLFFILLLSMIGLTNGAQAQIAVMDTSIVQYLERPETGGKVKVVQPAQLAKRVSQCTLTELTLSLTSQICLHW